jgi:hypothetical protein
MYRKLKEENDKKDKKAFLPGKMFLLDFSQ